MRRVFVDSGAFFALQVGQDASHVAATQVFQWARDERWDLITTNVVVIETHALLLSRTRTGRSAALAFLDSSNNRPCTSNESAAQTRWRR